MNRSVIPALLILLVAGSCRTLPNVTTFVTASSELRKGVNAGFDAVQHSLLADDLVPNNPALAEDELKIRQVVTIVDKTLLGVTAYAGALNNLVESGNSGEKNATQVADALTKIVDQVAPGPASEIVGLTAGQAARLYGQIAKVRAANDLKAIMDEAAPTVDSLRTVFSKITAQLVKLNRTVYQNKRQALIKSNTLNKNIIDYDTFLDREQVTVVGELALISQFKAGVFKQSALDTLKKLDPFITDEASIEPRQVALGTQSRRIDTEKARILPLTDRIRAGQRRYVDEFNMTDKLFRRSGDALNSWVDTHTDIRRQLDKKSPPNFEELVAIIDDIKEIRGKIKTLNP